MFRRLTTVVAAFAFASLTRCAVAVQLPERDWRYVELDDEHVEIYLEDQSREKCAIPQDTAGDLVVPEFLGGRTVVSIGKNAFYECSNLTSVQLPSSVTNISETAFYSCSSLTNVVFPSGLQAIGGWAFSGCISLRELDLECANLSIGEDAFVNDDGLVSLRFAGESLSLGRHAFFGCGGLRSVHVSARRFNVGVQAFFGGYDYLLPDKKNYNSCGFCGCLGDFSAESRFLSVESSALASCSSLTNAILRADLSATIGISAFDSCGLLNAVELPEALSVVQTNVFLKCSSLQSVVFPSNVTTIAYRAFDTCKGLASVSFGGKETVIEPQAFYGCSSLFSLNFPVAIERVGSRAFENCDALTNVVFAVPGSNDVRKTVCLENQAFYRCGSLVRVELPPDMSEIGAHAFVLCESLSELTMPTNLLSIAEHAFEDCSALTGVDLPETLQSIGRSAFYRCSSLKDFSIPTKQVVELGAKAFYNTLYWNEWPDNSLVENNGYILGFKGNPTSVALPDGCKAIPESMFEGMTSLQEVVVPSSVVTVGARAFAGSGVCNINLSGATTLGVSLFEGCASLTNVTLASGLEMIPASAFRDCSALTAIAIPASVTTIGEYAFYGCISLVTVSGGSGVRDVKDSAFENCVALQPFALPEGTAYGAHVFRNVPWTEYVLFPSVGTMQDEYPSSYAAVRSVVFPASVSSICDKAFQGCSSLESVVIPPAVTTLGALSFAGCTSLTFVKMSGSLVTVSPSAFEGCSSVASVVLSGNQSMQYLFPDRYDKISEVGLASDATTVCTNLIAGCVAVSAFQIPVGVTSIGARAFEGCTGLSGPFVVPETVDSIGDEAFSGCSGITTVRYLGEMPSVDNHIYKGTLGTLISAYLKENEESWTSDGEGLSYWPVGDDYRRPTGWWAGAKWATVTFDMGGRVYRIRILADGLHYLYEDDLPDEEDFPGFVSKGDWYLSPSGGDPVEFPLLITESLRLYQQYEYDESAESAEYDFDTSHVFRGYLLDGGTVVGTVEVKSAKGKQNKETDDVQAALTATVNLLGSGKVSLKGVLESDLTGTLKPTKRTDEREMYVEVLDGVSVLGLSGDFDGYEIVGAQDVFGRNTEVEKSVSSLAANYSGTYVAAFSAGEGLEVSDGCGFAVSVNVSSKGKARISGVLPDGTKLSGSAQMVWANGHYCVPVLASAYSGKRGGLGFVIHLDEAGVTVDSCSSWRRAGKTPYEYAVSAEGVSRVQKLSATATYSVTCDPAFEIDNVEVQTDLTPGAVEPFGATTTGWKLPKGDKVKFVKDEGAWSVYRDNGNCVGLKISYKPATGLFKGSFNVYGVTDSGKSYKKSVVVNGAVVDGVGYGHAYLKKVGSVPFVIVGE